MSVMLLVLADVIFLLRQEGFIIHMDTYNRLFKVIEFAFPYGLRVDREEDTAVSISTEEIQELVEPWRVITGYSGKANELMWS